MHKKFFLKKIKNILLILVVVFLFSNSKVNAEKECPIKDAPAEVLLNYKKVLNKKVSEISKGKEITDNSFLGKAKKILLEYENQYQLYSTEVGTGHDTIHIGIFM